MSLPGFPPRPFPRRRFWPALCRTCASAARCIPPDTRRRMAGRTGHAGPRRAKLPDRKRRGARRLAARKRSLRRRRRVDQYACRLSRRAAARRRTLRRAFCGGLPARAWEALGSHPHDGRQRGGTRALYRLRLQPDGRTARRHGRRRSHRTPHLPKRVLKLKAPRFSGKRRAFLMSRFFGKLRIGSRFR